MAARRLVLIVLVSMCTLIFALTLGAGASVAAGSFLFGSNGNGAGEITNTDGMAIDQEQGDVYVGDIYNNRVDKFDQAGNFVLAWGWGVVDFTEELQSCTTTCGHGQGGDGAGEFADESGPLGLAVDNDPLSASNGDVYVVDFSSFRVQKFDSTGKFLLMLGGHVNKTTGGNLCVAGEECQRGTEGSGDGEFDWVYGKAYVAVGPGGAVYVGDKARVQVFEPSGTWKENLSLSGLSSEGKVTALAVNDTGDVFVKDEGAPGVRELEPNGTEMPAKFDEGSESVEAIALDSSGDLLVSDTAGGVHFLKFNPSGQKLVNFGGGTLASSTSSMAYDDALEELYVEGNEGVWVFPIPPSGPLVELGSEKSTAELRGKAMLEASIDPEGNETSYRFEYVDESEFKSSGYASAVSTAAVSIGSSFEDQLASVHLTGLVPGGTYHWRVVATDSQHHMTTGSDETVEPIPPALIEGPSASSVTSSSVTLSAGIDPLGANTAYRLEYGTSTSYGHVLSGNVGEGMGYIPVSYPLQGLESGTTYHYRLVTSSEVGTVEGADRTFATELAGGALALPDGRAWELVSPADKGGALIEDIETAQAASDGSGIAYGATEPIGENVVGHLGSPGEPGASATLVSERGATGWRIRDVSPKQSLPPEGETAAELFGAKGQFELFSSDLSLAAFEPEGDVAPLSGEATERTLYLRDNTSETFLPLVSAADVPPGTKYGPPSQNEPDEPMELIGSTPDLGHVVFSTNVALTPEAVGKYGRNLYEWGRGQLQLVNSVPGGPTAPPPGLTLGSAQAGFGLGLSAHAISSDGRWIVFSYGHGGAVGYDVRDMVNKKTVGFGGPHASWQTMSSDGSKVFFLEEQKNEKAEEFGGESKEGDLYVFDPASGVTTDLTADRLDGESSAQVQDTLLGSSEDGSYVYFVAKGVLANGATSGKDNVYVIHDNGGGWMTTFIATLGSEDEDGWFQTGLASNAPDLKPSLLSSRVSPNGRFVTFMSNKSLTGYDNRDAVSGQPDEEVYLYDAVTRHLACASCDPSGARPVGLYQGGSHVLLLDSRGGGGGSWSSHWLAGVIPPAWHEINSGSGGFDTYQPRYLSDSGRLFFDSADALVPQDTNGLADVYEYEPSEVGSCTEADATFSERSDGCVNLISSGESASESTFFDASENGDDVFFITASKLVGEDYDTAYDVYDAHVCTTAAPCRTEPVSPPACTSGDSCKAAPSPQPAIFGAAPSATFNGVGNVLPTSTVSVKQKSLTRMQKLALALKTCHRKAKRKRAACERQARKRYGATRSRNSKATPKGDR